MHYFTSIKVTAAYFLILFFVVDIFYRNILLSNRRCSLPGNIISVCRQNSPSRSRTSGQIRERREKRKEEIDDNRNMNGSLSLKHYFLLEVLFRFTVNIYYVRPYWVKIQFLLFKFPFLGWLGLGGVCGHVYMHYYKILHL